MEIKFKYGLGQKVWFIDRDRLQARCAEVTDQCTRTNADGTLVTYWLKGVAPILLEHELHGRKSDLMDHVFPPLIEVV